MQNLPPELQVIQLCVVYQETVADFEGTDWGKFIDIDIEFWARLDSLERLCENGRTEEMQEAINAYDAACNKKKHKLGIPTEEELLSEGEADFEGDEFEPEFEGEEVMEGNAFDEDCIMTLTTKMGMYIASIKGKRTGTYWEGRGQYDVDGYLALELFNDNDEYCGNLLLEVTSKAYIGEWYDEEGELNGMVRFNR